MDYETEQDNLYIIGSLLRSKPVEEPTVVSDDNIANSSFTVDADGESIPVAMDSDPNHPNVEPETDTHGQSFIARTLSGMSSVGSDLSKAVVKGVPKGAEETLYGAAELVGAPVDLVNWIASKVPGVGQYISSDMPIGGSDSIKYVLDAYNNFVNENIPGAETANTWVANLQYDNQMLGNISEGLAQFSVAAVPAASMVKALTSANALVRGVYWGAIADYAAFNPNDETLTVMLTKMWDGATPEERSAISNTVIAIMEKNTDDPEIINRAKAMLEGGILGVASEGLVKVLIEGAKYVPWKKAATATAGGAAMNMQNPSDAEAGFLTSAVKGALKSGDNVASDVVEDTVNTSRRGFLKGIIATPIAISANNINKIIPEGIISKAAPNIGDGISNLSKLLSNGIFPDKQTLSAVASSIDNKILDLRDEGLSNSPDSEDLRMVLWDLEKLEKANVYPAKIDYFSNLSKDLYDTRVEDVIEQIKDDINTEPDMRVYTELDPMDYTKDIAGLKIEDIENLKDSTIPVNPDMGEPKGVLTSSSRKLLQSDTILDDTKTVLDARAKQMELSPKDRVQPSGQNPLFDTSPKSYEKTLVSHKQKEIVLPRNNGEVATLPIRDRARAVLDNTDAIAQEIANSIKPAIGSNVQYFYHTAPLIDKAVALGIPEKVAKKQLFKFAQNYAVTSPRTRTEENLRSASLVSAKETLGKDVTEILGSGGDGINEKGYPMMINEGGIHKKLIEDKQAGKLNVNTNPKPVSFAENVSGNLKVVTVDTHAIRAVFYVMNKLNPGSVPIDFIGGKKPKKTKEFQEMYKKDPSSLDVATMIKDTLAKQMINGKSMQTEYAVFADIYKKVAEIAGVNPAEAQSLTWFTFGDLTGLGSAPKTIVDLIDERVDVTSQLTGQSKEEVFKKFMQGAIPLASLDGLNLLDTGAEIGLDASTIVA
tara:strand:+ start:2698 stop:5505 length:2808 start_codon:yes stop_codon:yes gene_type:complete